MPIDLARLLSHEDIREALFFLCELRAEDDPRRPMWFTIEGTRDFTIIACDASGGVFVTLPSSPRVMFVSSEGQAGVIAGNIDEFVALMIACPYWRDLLRYSGGGKLDEMRRAQPALEESWLEEGDEEDNYDRGDLREQLMTVIDLTAPDDPVGLLFANVTTRVAFAHAEDRNALEPLFGRFTIDDAILKSCSD
jgi:hypothetical protein